MVINIDEVSRLNETDTLDAVDGAVAAWVRAEREGDAHQLDALLGPDFLGVGPFGFLLDREQWLRRFGDGLRYTAFGFVPDVATRRTGGSAFVVGTQTQQGFIQTRPIDGEFRVTLVFTGGPTRDVPGGVRNEAGGEAGWRLASAHLSLRTPPEARTRGGGPA